MTHNWKETTLGEVVEIFDFQRIPLSSSERAKRKGEYPYYGASDIVDYVDDYLFDGEYLLVSEDGENLNTRNTPIAFIANGKFWVNNHSHILKGKESHLTKYLCWYFSQLDISPYITGAVQPKLSQSNLTSIPIFLPSDPNEQKAIAAILSSLDDKIELLRRQNKTLEAIAQTIFKEWFVKFKIKGQKLKIKNETGLPEGWRVGKLSDEVEIVMGQSPDGKSYNESSDGMIFFQGRTDFQERFPTTRLYTTEPKRIAEKFDVLVGVRAPVGDINVAFDQCCIGRGLGAVRGKYKSYALYRIKSLEDAFRKFEDEGTVFGSIGKESFANIESIIPDNENIKSFEEIAGNIDKKIYNNYLQIQTLSKLRDLLLPKLMKGEIRVKL